MKITYLGVSVLLASSIISVNPADTMAANKMETPHILKNFIPDSVQLPSLKFLLAQQNESFRLQTAQMEDQEGADGTSEASSSTWDESGSRQDQDDSGQDDVSGGLDGSNSAGSLNGANQAGSNQGANGLDGANNGDSQGGGSSGGGSSGAGSSGSGSVGGGY